MSVPLNDLRYRQALLKLILYPQSSPKPQPPARPKHRCQRHIDMWLDEPIAARKSVQKEPPRPNHSAKFSKRFWVVLDVLENLIADNHIDARVIERQLVRRTYLPQPSLRICANGRPLAVPV